MQGCAETGFGSKHCVVLHVYAVKMAFWQLYQVQVFYSIKTVAFWGFCVPSEITRAELFNA